MKNVTKTQCREEKKTNIAVHIYIQKNKIMKNFLFNKYTTLINEYLNKKDLNK